MPYTIEALEIRVSDERSVSAGIIDKGLVDGEPYPAIAIQFTRELTKDKEDPVSVTHTETQTITRLVIGVETARALRLVITEALKKADMRQDTESC